MRRGPAPLIPPGCRAFQARGRPSHHFHSVSPSRSRRSRTRSTRWPAASRWRARPRVGLRMGPRMGLRMGLRTGLRMGLCTPSHMPPEWHAFARPHTPLHTLTWPCSPRAHGRSHACPLARLPDHLVVLAAPQGDAPRPSVFPPACPPALLQTLQHLFRPPALAKLPLTLDAVAEMPFFQRAAPPHGQWCRLGGAGRLHGLVSLRVRLRTDPAPQSPQSRRDSDAKLLRV